MTSEFPRGWRFIAEGIGGAPGPTTIAGVPGISHILTDITIQLSDASAGAITVVLSVTLNTNTIAYLLVASPGKDTSDVPVVFNAGPGNALSFGYGGFGFTANTVTIAVFQGYDV